MFDDEYREVADDLPSAHDQLSELEGRLATLDARLTTDPYELGESDRHRLLLQIANLARLVHKHDRALEAYTQVVEHYREVAHIRGAFLTDLKRLLVVCEFDPGLAIEGLSASLIKIDDDPENLEVYRPFALEYRARCRLRAGHFAEMVDDLTLAKTLFEERGMASQVEHAETWIAVGEKRLVS